MSALTKPSADSRWLQEGQQDGAPRDGKGHDCGPTPLRDQLEKKHAHAKSDEADGGYQGTLSSTVNRGRERENDEESAGSQCRTATLDAAGASTRS